MNDFNNMEEKVEETVKEMKERIDEITKSSQGIEDSDLASKANEIKDRAINVLNGVTKKLGASLNEVSDSEELKNVLEFVKVKSKALTEGTVAKLQELKDNEQLKKGLADAGNFVKQQTDKIKENENVQKVVGEVKEKTDEFFNKPEVAEKIESAKEMTLDVAEKAVKALKVWLRPDLYKEEVSEDKENKEE